MFYVDVDKLSDLIASKVVERLLQGQVGLIDQSSSPLGPKRHIAAVRKLVSSGAPGAAQVGRKFFLTREALEAELAAAKVKRREGVPQSRIDEDALATRFGLERA